MAADILEVAREFARELANAGEGAKAKLVVELMSEVKERRAKAEAPAVAPLIRVSIGVAKDAVTDNDGGPIFAADLFQHAGSHSVIGHVVLTRYNGKIGAGWDADAVKARKWAVTGVVTDFTDSHGLGFKVRHDDGSEAWYEPEHLMLRARKHPWQSALDVAHASGPASLLRKPVADRYAIGRMRGVVRRITEYPEAGTTRLECDIAHDDGGTWTRNAEDLVMLGPAS